MKDLAVFRRLFGLKTVTIWQHSSELFLQVKMCDLPTCFSLFVFIIVRCGLLSTLSFISLWRHLLASEFCCSSSYKDKKTAFLCTKTHKKIKKIFEIPASKMSSSSSSSLKDSVPSRSSSSSSEALSSSSSSSSSSDL